jgi:curved DNA-binding protein CbpA
MNHYEILEVSPKASAEVIRAAYKSLMQRVHPDKSPMDAAIAERAAQIVQSYELLSDPARRAEYDLELDLALRASAVDQLAPLPVDRHNPLRARTSAARETPERNSHFVMYAGLILAVIGFSGWSIKAMLKEDLSSESGFVATRPNPKREIPELLRDVTVKLQDPDNPLAESGIVLFIPAIGVRVGSQDAENAIRHLKNTKERLDQKLREALASASYPELIKADGERYLARKILDAINEKPADEAGNTPADTTTSKPDTGDHYGVVEVLLPESYSVK